MKSVTPADWKEEPLPAKSMRMQQFKLPKAEGDPEDGELALFFFRGNAGSVQDNLARQEKKFEIPAGTKPEDAIKVEKIKLGGMDAVYQDITGTYLKKTAPFDPNAKVTKMTGYPPALRDLRGEGGAILHDPRRPREDNRKAQEALRGVGEELQVISLGERQAVSQAVRFASHSLALAGLLS